MSRKLAIKRLRQSDLSLFKSGLARYPKGKQKGFNIDKAVLEGTFFPSLTAFLEPLDKRATPVDLILFGPGVTQPDALTRKVKRDAKNFRLNGEVVNNPLVDPVRYDVLAPDDFALMEFTGAAAPSAVKVVLVAAGHLDDAGTHRALAALFPIGSMRPISEDEIRQAIQLARPPPAHPIRDWLDEGLEEEVGRGDGEATEQLNHRRPNRGMSLSELQSARAAAERIGRIGEELLDDLLGESPSPVPDIAAHEWVAQVNAISPFDFLLTTSAGVVRHADAKSTSGSFDNPIHLSIAEIHHATQSGVPYDIFRLFDVKESSAMLRIAPDVASRLAPVVDALRAMPAGVKVDSLSFEPTFFGFAPEEIAINLEDDAAE